LKEQAYFITSTDRRLNIFIPIFLTTPYSEKNQLRNIVLNSHGNAFPSKETTSLHKTL